MKPSHSETPNDYIHGEYTPLIVTCTAHGKLAFIGPTFIGGASDFNPALPLVGGIVGGAVGGLIGWGLTR